MTTHTSDLLAKLEDDHADRLSGRHGWRAADVPAGRRAPARSLAHRPRRGQRGAEAGHRPHARGGGFLPVRHRAGDLCLWHRHSFVFTLPKGYGEQLPPWIKVGGVGQLNTTWSRWSSW